MVLALLNGMPAANKDFVALTVASCAVHNSSIRRFDKPEQAIEPA